VGAGVTLERASGVRIGRKLKGIGGGDAENDRTSKTATGVLCGREERMERGEREEREERSSQEEIERNHRLFDLMLKNDAVVDCGIAHIQVPYCPIYLLIY
jgi:hypothetical protein